MSHSGEADSPVGERQVPFFCPYCGEEAPPCRIKAGDWECDPALAIHAALHWSLVMAKSLRQIAVKVFAIRRSMGTPSRTSGAWSSSAAVVALRRTKALAEAGADVTVIAPDVTSELAALPVTVRRRRYRAGDLTGAWLAHAATDDPAVNALVAADAERERIWCVRADDGAASAARTPAVTRHGDLTVAVTSGGDPRRSQRLRSAIALALADGSLPVRPHRRLAATSAEAGVAGRERRAVGSVALVGGGPGDPSLITVRGRRLLAEADVVVADRLGPRALLDDLDPDVEIVLAGKAPGAHTMTQDEINALIVDRALAGRRVVRLKGGDPFVFGRGGEEALACVDAGVPFEVVPGVTSAVAVPAYAGIPVTHRGITQDFAVVSAHLDPSQPGASVEWESLARGPGTLVLLMAVAPRMRSALNRSSAAGRATTPVAVIRDGTLPGQEVLIHARARCRRCCQAASQAASGDSHRRRSRPA
jgi:uroporphyrin-III C-methyltransferase/precorrin-2 dehydrogenase/sirohydrochlorin ferrochelatase